MVNKLTQEQLEDAARTARDAFAKAVTNWEDVDFRNAWIKAIEAAAPHLQYAREAPQDVVEAMLDAFFASHPNDPWRKYCESDRKMFRRDMTAAFHVCAAWCRERMLADPTSEEACEAEDSATSVSMHEILLRFVRERRAHPLLPEKTVEERVVISPQADGHVFITVDGESVAEVLDGQLITATAMRLGLIAELKREGR